MKELTIEDTINVNGGAIPLAVIAVAKAISYVGGVAGAIAWLMD